MKLKPLKNDAIGQRRAVLIKFHNLLKGSITRGLLSFCANFARIIKVTH